MFSRITISLAFSAMLSGCVITPEIEMTERLDFDYVPQNVQPMSYNDLLCCEQCSA